MSDFANQINAVHREVHPRTVDGRPARAVIVSQTYPAPIEDVWEACTTAERIARWMMPVTGDLRLGGRYQLAGNAGGEVLQCDPPRRLALTWEFGGTVSWVTVTLTPAGEGGTRFELEHVNPVNEHWERFGPSAVGIGWDMTLLGLSLHLQGGSLGSAEEAAAWAASGDGHSFMRSSGAGWHAADVAGGEAPAQARGAADRAIAAYTGAPVPGSD
jgi:uncharacterized protein YndB with AHSA1/START domain